MNSTSTSPVTRAARSTNTWERLMAAKMINNKSSGKFSTDVSNKTLRLTLEGSPLIITEEAVVK
jgi:hypothetical protein